MNKKNKMPPLIQGFTSENVLRLLAPLKESPNGTIIYRHVTHAIQEMERAQNKICFGYATVLYNIIKALRNQLPKQSLLNLELKLIQQRLAPPITITELAAIQEYLKKSISLMSQLASPDENAWLAVLAPLIGTLTNEKNQSDAKPESDQVISDESAVNFKELDSSRFKIEDLDSRIDIQQPEKIPTLAVEGERENSPEKQNELMSSIFDAMQHQARFGLLLEEMLQQLHKAENKNDVDAVRGHAINELQKMLSEQSALVRTLNQTQNFANMLNQNSHRLSKELTQARVLSMTDELTELPNRRAFMNRLHDEVQRSRRYDSSFSLALLDLDEFKTINDTYGHAAGDEVLRCYSSEVLSLFRVSDLVARYGGEEFAIIFPNTSVKESLQAMEKAQAKAFTLIIRYDGDDIRAPSFSAGLITYIRGEDEESLLQRVDRLLYKAKENGRRRIEVEDTTDEYGLPMVNISESER